MTEQDKRLDGAMDAVAKLMESHGIDQRGGKKYVQVVHRVEQLRRAFGTLPSIETVILEDDGERVLMKATVSLGGAVVGTGHAEEIRGLGYVNKQSCIENCETSAIGRALAACGLAGGEYASMNELDGVVRKEAAQESKVKVPPADRLPTVMPSEHPPDDRPSQRPPVEKKSNFTKEQKTEKYEAIIAWLDSGSTSEKAIAGMIAKSAELVDKQEITQRDQRKIMTECLIRISEWDQAQAYLVRMENNSYLTKNQVAEYMERIDAGRSA